MASSDFTAFGRARPRARVLALMLTRLFALSLAPILACASGPSASSQYPHRPPGCELALYHTPVPGVALWDDLGIAEAACHISTPENECLRALKAEACRMGGDIIYNVPRKPFRPQDQAMLFRGQVAHSRAGAPKKETEDEAGLPPPATPEESAGPVVPLVSPAGPPPPATPRESAGPVVPLISPAPDAL